MSFTGRGMMLLGLKIFAALVLLVVLFVVGVFVYATMEKRGYKRLSDTRDLKERVAKLAQAYVAKRPNAALILGVLQNGQEHVQGFGADRATIYEIGSITKVFTAITLAKLSLDGVVKLDESVGKCLPADVPLPRNISFTHLATHSSGLPRLPDNFMAIAGNRENDPYAAYRKEHLYEWLRNPKKLKHPGGQMEYSNAGFGLLGHALELCAKKPYEALVREHLLEPLDMRHTAIQTSNVIAGHDPKGKAAGHWTFDVLAPAGAFRSNADDMLKFVRANLEPDRTPIAAALRLSHKRHFKDWAGQCGLGWQIRTTFEDLTFLWHNGGTAGFISFVGFDPRHKTGLVLLSNYGDAMAGDHSLDKMGFEILKLASKISL